jgi:hypothetical protein
VSVPLLSAYRLGGQQDSAGRRQCWRTATESTSGAARCSSPIAVLTEGCVGSMIGPLRREGVGGVSRGGRPRFVGRVR